MSLREQFNVFATLMYMKFYFQVCTLDIKFGFYAVLTVIRFTFCEGNMISWNLHALVL